MKALLKFETEKSEKQTSNNLLEDEVDEDGQSKAPVWLVLGLDKVPEAKKVKPITLYIILFPYDLKVS